MNEQETGKREQCLLVTQCVRLTVYGYSVTNVHAYLPMDSSKEKMTSFPVLANSWILFPIHLKPGSVSWDGETSNRTNGTGHREPFNQQECKYLTNINQIYYILYMFYLEFS